MLPSPFIAHHLLDFDQQQISEQQQMRKQLIFGWSSEILFSSVKTLLSHWVMEDAQVQLLLFSKKSWDGRFPFSKYPMCFSIQTPQNSASSIRFTGTSSSPRSSLLVQQHVDREQLSLCAFPVLNLPKTAVRNVALAKDDGGKEVTVPHAHQFLSILPIYLQLSSLGSAQSELSHQKLIHLLLDQGNWFTLKLHNPFMWCKEENRDMCGSGDMKTERLASLVAAHSCTRLSTVWTTLEEHVDYDLSTGENTIL